MVIQHGGVVGTDAIDIIATAVFARQLASGEEHRVVVLLGVYGPRLLVIVPRLKEQDTRLGACVRLERVDVKADNRKYSRAVGNPPTDPFIALVVETALRQ